MRGQKRACNFTKRNLDQLEPEEKPYRVFDEGGQQSEKGLCVYVWPSGTKSFLYYKRYRGKPVTVTLGRYPDITLGMARTKAKKSSALMTNEMHPNDLKRRQNERGISFDKAFEAYLKKRNLADNTLSGYRNAVDKYLADWKTRELISITESDIKTRYKMIAAQSVESANKAMRVLRAVHNLTFKKATDERGNLIRIANPVNVLNKEEDNVWKTSEPRSDRLLIKQFEDWFNALEHINPVHADYLQFVLLTGIRRREAACLKISNINFDEYFVKVYSSKTKSFYNVHLSDYLLALLGRRTCESDTWVFPSPYSKTGYLQEPKSTVAKIAKLSGIKVSAHGLRRTFISIATSVARVPPYGVKLLVNHATPKQDVTVEHYVNFEDEQLRRYMQEITDAMLKMAGREKSADIVNLHGIASANHE